MSNQSWTSQLHYRELNQSLRLYNFLHKRLWSSSSLDMKLGQKRISNEYVVEGSSC